MKSFNYASITLVGIIILATALRVSHILPNNFAPITAICLLGSAYFTRKWMAFVFPAIILFISDSTLGLGRPVESFGIYFSYILIILLGFNLTNKVRPLRVLGITVSSSLLFFIITNFTCWIGNPVYSQDMNGFFLNYTLALPFFTPTFVSDVLFSAIFFSVFELAKVNFPKFAPVK